MRVAAYIVSSLIAGFALIVVSANSWSAATLDGFTLNEIEFSPLAPRPGAVDFYPEGSGPSSQWVERVVLEQSATDATATLSAAIATLKTQLKNDGVRLIRDYPVTTTGGSPEHFLVAVANGEGHIELTVRRIMSYENVVLELIYARREYGAGVGPTLSRWMQENGEQLENQLLNLAIDEAKTHVVN